MVRNVIQNYVVTLVALGKILLSVINYVICAERSDHVQISRAAYTSHVCSHRFGNLHRERAYTSRGTVNQDLLPRLNLSFVATSLYCVDSRARYRSRLLKRTVGTFRV